MTRMRAFVVLALFTVAYCIFGSAAEGDAVDFRVVQSGSHFFMDFRSDTVRMSPVMVALHSKTEEEHFLASYPRRVQEFPAVNYDSETVIIVTLGTRGSGSIRVKLDSLVVRLDTVMVYAVEARPCIFTGDMANPSMIVGISGRSRTVAFAPIRIDNADCK